MELKAIIAIALVVFIIGGLIFLKVRSRRSNQPGAAMRGRPFYIPKKKGALMMKERFEQRLFRIFAQAGYSPGRSFSPSLRRRWWKSPALPFPTSGRCCASRTRCWQTGIKSAAADWWRNC